MFGRRFEENIGKSVPATPGTDSSGCKEKSKICLIEIQKGCGKDKERPEICFCARPGAGLVKAGNAGVG